MSISFHILEMYEKFTRNFQLLCYDFPFNFCLLMTFKASHFLWRHPTWQYYVHA
jgi:hypothetical protein